MKVSGVSQRQLAQIAGYTSHSYVHRLLKREAYAVDDAAALKIAHYLGVNVQSLFSETPPVRRARQPVGR